MEIEDHIVSNADVLKRWGNYIKTEVHAFASDRLKVPASVRVKDPDSARVKQIQKNYQDPILQMRDQVGARFVVLTLEDVEAITLFIEQHGAWRFLKARDPHLEIAAAPEYFGYQSFHYELVPQRVFGEEPLPNFELCCEVQVRTLLQHAYAELTHDTMYKTDRAVPSQASRLVARSMALMETTDELIRQAVDAVRLANAPADALYQFSLRTVGRFESASGGNELFDLVALAFRERMTQESSCDLASFIDAHPFVVDRIGCKERTGLFAYPELALIASWLIQTDENVLERWPFGAQRSELEFLESVLGR